MIGCTNSTATCSASQELPPLPMTNNWCPADSALANRLQTSSRTPAFASKKRSFISALSRHLRRTASLKLRRACAAWLMPSLRATPDAGRSCNRPRTRPRPRPSSRPAASAACTPCRTRGTGSASSSPFSTWPADADRRFLRADVLHLEDPLGVVIAELVAQLVAALRDDADAAPAPVRDVEHARDHLPRRHVAVDGHRARVLRSPPRRAPAPVAGPPSRTPSSRSSGSKPVITIGTL